MTYTKNTMDVPIKTWQDFTRIVRSTGCKQLKRLDEFPNSILVTGCQRSGTTMLARIITQSAGMTNYWFGKDDELDAALILSGCVDHVPYGRYCFQTTYLDECYQEYYEHGETFKMIWVIRNPYSVAYSLMYHWRVGALEDTFKRVGVNQISAIYKLGYWLFGSTVIKPVQQAGLVYNAKTLQLIELAKRIGPNRLFVVDYDELVQKKEIVLREIYRFISLEYLPEYSERIHNKSLEKKSSLSEDEKRAIQKLSAPIYRQALLLKSSLPDPIPA